MRKVLVFGVAAAMLGGIAVAAQAQSVAVSIGVRETEAGGGPTGVPAGGNAGTAGGIEWVNLDGQSLLLNGTWQTFTFNFQTDPITGFAGGTANGILEGARGALEHIRFRNVDGITSPGVRIWIDAIVNTTAAGGPQTVSGFEGTDPFPAAVGSPHMFQLPNFSGSTAGFLVAPPAGPNTAVVTDAQSFSGSNSLLTEWEWNSNNPAGWVRLTTFGPSGGVPQPNPSIGFDGTLTFALRGELIPEPAGATLFGLASAAMLLVRRRK